MKIHSLEFIDRETDWQIEPIEFNNLTLLVGASGVGKTRILKSIGGIKSIAKGKSLNGVEWKIAFSIEDNKYFWEGKFEMNEQASVSIIVDEEDVQKDKDSNKPVITFEKLTINEKTIAERNNSSLIFRGEKTMLPLKAEQSVVFLIPDPEISKVEKAFRRIIFSDYTNSARGFMGEGIKMLDEQFLSKYKNIDNVRDSEEPLSAKFYWASKKDKKLFSRIKEDFISVFPQVKDLKIEPLTQLKDSPIPVFIKALPFIQIKEDNVKNWIPVMSISAGMYRTLVHVMELHLSANGTVILIDEFENSLGVNCIDELTTELKGATNRIQFILTSHHPYIINSISVNNWKIVTRNGSSVSAQDAKDFNFQKSKHEAFIQLINSPEYKTGRRSI